MSPGWIAQREMSPPDRQKLVDEGRLNPSNPRTAAVLILIYEESERLKFPVILRNTYKGVHSNQIGFPGGKVEESDKNLEETAKRESFEEINANPEKIEVLGELSEIFIPPSNFLVYPYVGIYKSLPDFKPCDFEVKEIIHIDLIDFILNSDKRMITLKHKSKPYVVPAFQLENGMQIWGATAMMLNEFHAFLRNSLSLPTDQ